MRTKPLNPGENTYSAEKLFPCQANQLQRGEYIGSIVADDADIQYVYVVVSVYVVGVVDWGWVEDISRVVSDTADIQYVYVSVRSFVSGVAGGIAKVKDVIFCQARYISGPDSNFIHVYEGRTIAYVPEMELRIIYCASEAKYFYSEMMCDLNPLLFSCQKYMVLSHFETATPRKTIRYMKSKMNFFGFLVLIPAALQNLATTQKSYPTYRLTASIIITSSSSSSSSSKVQ